MTTLLDPTWSASLRQSKVRLAYLKKKRGLNLDTIRGARIGWDGSRYTIPVRTPEGKFVNVRRYSPTSPTDKMISLAGRGKPRLYAPAESPSDDARVLMVEGELDCLKASQELPDYWVVSSTGGASNLPPVTDLETLLGREVVVAYDCDDAGRKGALKLAAALEGIAFSVRVADLGLDDGQDLTDWFVECGRDAEQLRTLFYRARFYRDGLTATRRETDVLGSRAHTKAEEGGSRNEAMFWLACQLRDERYTEAEARPVVLEFAHEVSGDKAQPVSDSEALDTLTSAYREPPRQALLAGADAGDPSRFPLIGPASLAEPVAPMGWLIRGVWPLGSYGPWGGPKKSLKTYIASACALAVAAGRPAFNNDQWDVPEPRPVIYYGGEGGRRMHQARLQRIARDLYGIEDLSELPFYLVTDVGPFDGREFREALRRNLTDVMEKHGQVGLVVLDSLYNYHPADIEVSNLYERGRLLGGLSAPLVDEQIAVWVVDHFNKSGSGIDLDRLAQSGMSAWADSWVLFEHSRDPDVPNGSFAISAGIGSRQWGGDEWTLHIDIGPFDTDTGTYLTAMKVEAERGLSPRRGSSASDVTDSDVNASIFAFIDANPDSTKQMILAGVMEEHAVGRDRVKRQFAALADEARIRSVRRPRREGGRNVSREVWEAATVKVAGQPDRASAKLPAKVTPKRNPAGNSAGRRHKVGEKP